MLTVRITTARIVQAIIMKMAPPKSGSNANFFLTPILADHTSYGDEILSESVRGNVKQRQLAYRQWDGRQVDISNNVGKITHEDVDSRVGRLTDVFRFGVDLPKLMERLARKE